MTIAALAGLAGLALVDSTSFGTLLLPIMMLVAPRVRRRNVLIYLATIAIFYFVVGIALLLGVTSVIHAAGPVLQGDGAKGVQIALGLVLVALSILIDPKRLARRRARRGLPPKPPGAWRQRALGPEASATAIITVALIAGLIEVASMLPYLAAVGILVAAGISWIAQVGVLAGYVLVMITPALALLAVRRAAGTRIEPRLRRIENWLGRHSSGAASWLVAIIGVLIAADGVQALAM